MDIKIPYSPRPLQQRFHKEKKRWNYLLCHRRFGKTVMTINQLIKDAMMCTDERPRFAYIAPTYKMAKSIVWDYLKHYASVIPGTKFNEAELRADFPNGSRVMLLGGDNVDALRGIYLDGAVLDEYAQMRPSLFTEVIRPALSDRQGYAVFIGTPKGKNHFYDLYNQIKDEDNWYVNIHRASETGYVSKEELDEAKKIMTADEYMQEFECSFDAAIKGAFYADDIQQLNAEQRVCKVSYDKNLKVNTYWDIGFRDDTAILFVQIYGQEIRIIDTYSNSGMTLADYHRVLVDKGYNYGTHYFPWDAKIKPMSMGKSTLDIAKELGMKVDLSPSVSVLEGINQARMMFQRCWFNEEQTRDLLNALSSYRREYDDKNQTFRANPLHDWSSHYADAFRYLALCVDKDNPTRDSDYNEAYQSYINKEINFNF